LSLDAGHLFVRLKNIKATYNKKIEATGHNLAGFSGLVAPAPHLSRYAHE